MDNSQTPGNQTPNPDLPAPALPRDNVIPHDHSGIGSPQIDPKSLKNFRTYCAIATIFLNPAQIKALHSTPVILIPNPGLTAAIIVEGISAKILYTGTQYTGSNALEFRYTDGSGTKTTADIPSSFIDASVTSYYHTPGISTAFAPIINTPVVVAVP